MLNALRTQMVSVHEIAWHAMSIALTQVLIFDPLGDSGSGKSLLVSKAIDLITGGRAVPSLVPPSNGKQESASSVEMSEYILDFRVQLHNHHVYAQHLSGDRSPFILLPSFPK